MTKARTPADPVAVSVQDAAEMLGISKHTLYRLIHSDELPHIFLGGRYVIPLVVIERMLADAMDASTEV